MAHHATVFTPSSAPPPHLREFGVYGFDYCEPMMDAMLARLDVGVVMGELGMRTHP
jgi:hypothetical protein